MIQLQLQHVFSFLYRLGSGHCDLPLFISIYNAAATIVTFAAMVKYLNCLMIGRLKSLKVIQHAYTYFRLKKQNYVLLTRYNILRLGSE